LNLPETALSDQNGSTSLRIAQEVLQQNPQVADFAIVCTFEFHSPFGICRALSTVEPMMTTSDEPALSGPTCSSPSRHQTILLVEDEDFVRNVTREVLELEGYHVLEAIHAEDGLELYRENADIIDLLLTDVVMPGLNGRDFANQLLAIKADLKIIFMSGYTDNAVVREGFSDPRLNYIQKPFTLDALSRKVEEVLRDKTSLVPLKQTRPPLPGTCI
jgi:CheY-like chemotaxis protein